jgi:predicted phage tail protein
MLKQLRWIVFFSALSLLLFTQVGSEAVVKAFFQEEVDRLPAPTLLSPAPGAYIPPGPVTMTWSEVPGATSYAVVIERDGFYEHYWVNTPTNSLTLTDLEPGFRYHWSAVAVDDADPRRRSPEAPFRWFALSAVKLPPATPMWYLASQGSFKKYVLVEWSLMTDAKYYQVIRTDPQTGSRMVKKVTGRNVLLDRQARPGVEYHYQVQACNKYGCSEPTPARVGWAGVCSDLTAPQMLSPADGAVVQYEPDINDVILEWVNVPGAGSYELEVWYADSGERVPIEPGYDKSVSVYNLNGDLLWRIRAIDFAQGCKAGPWSETWAFTAVPAPPPAAPVNFQASQGIYPDKIVLTWEQPQSETQAFDFDIFRAESLDGVKERISYWSGFPYIFEDDYQITPGTTYYYWVNACHPSRGCSLSQPTSGFASVEACSALPAPQLLSPADGERFSYEADLREYRLEWQPITGVTNYRIQVTDTATGQLVRDELYPYHSFEVIDLAGTFRWQVQAVSPIAECTPGPWSETWTYTAYQAPPPLPPANLAATQGDYPDRVVLTWDELEYETQAMDFPIYRSESPDGPPVRVWGVLASPYVDENVEPGVVYYYWVEAYHHTRGIAVSGPVSGWAGSP